MAEFSISVRVYYEDTDAAGVVYYANYLKFMERARTDYLRSLGFDQSVLREEHGVSFVVRKAAVDFRAPARFDELLDVSAGIASRRRASFDFAQLVSCEGRPLVSAQVQIACVDAESFRPRPVPQTLIEVLEREC